MRTILLSLALLTSLAASGAEVVRVAPWEFHDSFWMSLHQTLIADAMKLAPRDLSALTADDRKLWDECVEAYRKAGGTGDLTFARPMIITNDALTQVADDAIEPLIDAPLAETLLRAAPVYRKYWWTADENASRFFIAYAAAMMREAGAELVHQHETVYGTPWPRRIYVYITPFAGPFGAYTLATKASGAVTTMSCRDEGYQGVHAVEMLLHESSHLVVGPNNGRVASAIAAASKRAGIDVPRNLWHAILFATSSELARLELARLGVTTFVPSSADLFTRAWPKYREPVEKHWLPYVRSGQGTLEEAIDKVVQVIPR